MADDIDEHERALLLNFLTERDVHCPLCQYNLRNSTVTNCPECGKAIRLAVRSPELSHLPWGLLTFVLALPAGIGIVFLIMWIKEGLPPSPRRDERYIIWMFVGTIPLALAALVLRQRFLRLPKGAQQGLAATGALLSLVLFILFVTQMMR